MRVTREEVAFEGKFIRTMTAHFQTRSGKMGVWEYVARKTFGNIVSIFALTKDNEVILEKIFRIPMKSYVIELPAGLMDKKGERPESAVKRELLEETGYTYNGDAELILTGPFSAGIRGDEIMVFFVKDVEMVQEPKLEDEEDITVIKVPLDELVAFVTQKRAGCPIDIKILSVLPVLQKKGLIKGGAN